jgi:hypothetical protein
MKTLAQKFRPCLHNRHNMLIASSRVESEPSIERDTHITEHYHDDTLDQVHTGAQHGAGHPCLHFICDGVLADWTAGLGRAMGESLMRGGYFFGNWIDRAPAYIDGWSVCSAATYLNSRTVYSTTTLTTHCTPLAPCVPSVPAHRPPERLCRRREGG